MRFIPVTYSTTKKDKKKKKRRKMSCHNGNIPVRQDFVLFYRKKHYFRMEKANVESWNLMILD